MRRKKYRRKCLKKGKTEKYKEKVKRYDKKRKSRKNSIM
jgi:hypothetical protein